MVIHPSIASRPGVDLAFPHPLYKPWIPEKNNRKYAQKTIPQIFPAVGFLNIRKV
jgi:hypothetical protein